MVVASLVVFTDDTAGIEKLLRLIQGLCMTVIGLCASPKDAVPFITARAQLALGRRYLRLLKWYPCFQNATKAMQKPRDTIAMLLNVLKFTFLGLYFALEASTITNVMGATDFTWGSSAQREGNKFWVYSLAISILLILYTLVTSTVVVDQNMRPRAQTAGTDSTAKEGKTTTDQKNEKLATTKENTIAPQANRAALYKQLVIDSCDLLTPGSALGWIPADVLLVGIAMTISSLLGAQQIQQRLQAKQKAR